MLTKKDYLKIIAVIIAAIIVVWGIIWLIIYIAPILIGAIIFIPWLGAALAAGADV